jgi:hypothetical protein
MADALITEHAGTRQGPVTRLYQYGSGGIRVLNAAKGVKRLYLFDPSSSMMTERDSARQEKVLRRFVFDPYGMLEETFSFGERPRTFRFEDGASRIAVREGGDYGAVGKIFTFEGNGIAETAWGRNGEVERVYVFEPGNGVITLRKGGWFGDVDRTIVFEGIGASVFREPEAFLQFLMFTEWSAKDREENVQEQVAKIRGGEGAGGSRSRYAYTGKRQSSGAGGAAPRAPGPGMEGRDARRSRSNPADAGIDFIPDGDSPSPSVTGELPSRRSDGISFGERLGRDRDTSGQFSAGRSAEIPLEERFESARREREPLSRGRSVEIPLEERFESSHSEREPLSRGRSVEIPLEERFEGSHNEREPLSRGRSVEIPLEERFENARRDREKLSKGKSAEIPYDERKGSRD